MWTYADQEKALADGWGVFSNTDHGERIERHDEMERFKSDAAAIAYVGRQAAKGNRLARKAFKHLARVHEVNR